MTGIKLFLIFIPILAIILLLINFILAPHRPYKEKNTPFECGYHSFLYQNRSEFNVSFYLFGILFIDFDLEIVLVTPGAPSLYFNDLYGISSIILFVAILGVGFIYELGKGVLKIDSKQHKILIQSGVDVLHIDSILEKTIVFNISMQIYSILLMIHRIIPIFVFTYVSTRLYSMLGCSINKTLILNILILLFTACLVYFCYDLLVSDSLIILMSGSESLPDVGEAPSHGQESSSPASRAGPSAGGTGASDNNDSENNDESQNNSKNKRKRPSSEEPDDSESRPRKAPRLDHSEEQDYQDNIQEQYTQDSNQGQDSQNQSSREYDPNNAVQSEPMEGIETVSTHESDIESVPALEFGSPSTVENTSVDTSDADITLGVSANESSVNEDSCGCRHSTPDRDSRCSHDRTRTLSHNDAADFRCCICRQSNPDLSCDRDYCSCVIHSRCLNEEPGHRRNDNN